jgi:hypothetical protein
MAYTTINKSGDYFNTKLYTGTGSSNAITGVGFQPDLTWIKSRSDTHEHKLTDVVRGVTKALASDNNTQEFTDVQGLTAFGSDGYTVGTDSYYNTNGHNYASWNWKAGNSQGSSNTDGSINTTYTSVNTTAGFSISKYTGTASNATVGHGLGAVPKMIIVKNLISSGGSAEHWYVYHASLGNNKDLLLNLTNDASNTVTTWNNTTPTSSVFSIGSGDGVNKSSEANIAYCFAEKTGYSKFGSYVGNGNNANGTFVYTGFKPAFVIFKRTSGTGNWQLLDNKRLGYNPLNYTLYPNTTTTDQDEGDIHLYSNGFQLRGTGTDGNGSGSTYIYMAFAEAPLVGTNGVTAKAR